MTHSVSDNVVELLEVGGPEEGLGSIDPHLNVEAGRKPERFVLATVLPTKSS